LASRHVPAERGNHERIRLGRFQDGTRTSKPRRLAYPCTRRTLSEMSRTRVCSLSLSLSLCKTRASRFAPNHADMVGSAQRGIAASVAQSGVGARGDEHDGRSIVASDVVSNKISRFLPLVQGASVLGPEGTNNLDIAVFGAWCFDRCSLWPLCCCVRGWLLDRASLVQSLDAFETRDAPCNQMVNTVVPSMTRRVFVLLARVDACWYALHRSYLEPLSGSPDRLLSAPGRAQANRMAREIVSSWKENGRWSLMSCPKVSQLGPWDAFLRNARLRVIAFLPSDASLRDARFPIGSRWRLRNWVGPAGG